MMLMLQKLESSQWKTVLFLATEIQPTQRTKNLPQMCSITLHFMELTAELSWLHLSKCGVVQTDKDHHGSKVLEATA